MKQDAQLTAVEWLVDKILTEADKYNEDGDVIGIELWNAYKGCVDLSKFVEQAKEMEKNQIMDAYKADLYPCSDEDAEQYYNQNFKSE